MVKIYGLLTPNVLKPVLVAEELGVNYEWVNVNLMAGEGKLPAHLERDPFGRIPVLEQDGRFLSESNAICRYLGNFTQNSLYPIEKWQRGKVDQWIDYSTFHLGRYVTGIFVQRCVAGPVFKRKPDEHLVKLFEGQLAEELPIVEKHLEKNAYLAGATYTLADVVLFSLVCPHKVASIDLSAYPKLTQWYASIRQRSAVEKIVPKLPMPYMS